MSKEVKTKATELRQVLGKTTQDQPGVELLGGEQPRKTIKMATPDSRELLQEETQNQVQSRKAKTSEKEPGPSVKDQVLILRNPVSKTSNVRERNGKKITTNRRRKKEIGSISGANTGQCLCRHRVDWLVLGNAQRVFVAHQGLCVQFERLAHQLCNSEISLANRSHELQEKKHSPPDYDTVQDVTPYTGHGRTEFPKGVDSVVIKQVAHFVVNGQLRLRRWLIVMFQAVEPEA